jgi:hypothetical protein
MTRQEHDHDAKSQLDKFRDLARELECDEDEAAFKEKVRIVSKGNGAAKMTKILHQPK